MTTPTTPSPATPLSESVPLPISIPAPTPDSVHGGVIRGIVQRCWTGLKGLAWLVVWIPEMLIALLVASVVALWIWAATPHSLPYVLRWAQSYTAEHAKDTGQLRVTDAQGNLHQGGKVGSLVWEKEGLRVQADGVDMNWSASMWVNLALGRGIAIHQVHASRVLVTDTRALNPPDPLTQLPLPFAVSLGFSVDTLELVAQAVSIAQIKGLYAYTAIDGKHWEHLLKMDSAQFAQGNYQGQLRLGDLSPMPLALEVQGRIAAQVPDGKALSLQALVKAQGHLAGTDASITSNITLAPVGSSASQAALQADLVVKPNQNQVLQTVKAQLNSLDVSALWPKAPVTALSGRVTAQPEGDNWRGQAELTNHLAGPWDKQRLPLTTIRLAVSQKASVWTLEQLRATLAGGSLTADATVTLRDNPTPNGGPTPDGGTTQNTKATQATQALSAWAGNLELVGIDPAQLLGSLPAGTYQAKAQAKSEGKNIRLSLNANGQHPNRRADTRTSAVFGGLWLPGNTLGSFQIDEAKISAAQAQLEAKGLLQLDTPSFNGSAQLRLPGLNAQTQGLQALKDGQGQASVEVSNAQQLQDWLLQLEKQPLPKAWLAALTPLKQGQYAGAAKATVQWQGNLDASAGVPTARFTLDASAPLLSFTPKAPPSAAYSTPVPQAWSLKGLAIQSQGPASDTRFSLRGEANAAAHTVALQTVGQLRWTEANGNAQLQLDSLTAAITPDANKAWGAWRLSSAQALQLQWSRSTGAVTVGQGDLRLSPPAQARLPHPDYLQTARIQWSQIQWQKGALTSSGKLDNLPLAWVDFFARTAPNKSTDSSGRQGSDIASTQGVLADAGLRSNVLLAGSWDIALPLQAGQALRLNARLERQSGDVALLQEVPAVISASTSTTSTSSTSTNTTTSTVTSSTTSAPAGQPIMAGITQAQVIVSNQNNAIQVRFDWNSTQLGQASGQVRSTLSPPGAAPNSTWTWGEQTPVEGSIKAQLPQIGIWSFLAPPGWRMQGTLNAQAALSGTRNKPLWNGTLTANNLAVRSVVNGIEFSNGKLQASLQGERILIDSFTLQGAGADKGGSLSATGQAEWITVPAAKSGGKPQREAHIDLNVNANGLRVSSRADRRLAVSGLVTAQLRGPKLVLRGKVTADSALYLLPDELTPTLGDDVVVRGRSTANASATGTHSAVVQPDVLIDIDLGPQFEVRGRGLKAFLRGQLQVRSTALAPAPMVLGEVRIERGTYKAYGQDLSIDSSVVRFSGPYDNPTLNIVAVRPNISVRVGVKITGNVNSPRVRLFSEPELPENEKLAWLVLGRRAAGGGAEAAIMQQAALALLSSATGKMDGGIAQKLGLDDVSVRGSSTNADGTTASAVVSLGKRISDKVYVRYESSVAGALGTISLFYDFSKRFTLRAQTGDSNAIDLIFTLTYD